MLVRYVHDGHIKCLYSIHLHLYLIYGVSCENSWKKAADTENRINWNATLAIPNGRIEHNHTKRQCQWHFHFLFLFVRYFISPTRWSTIDVFHCLMRALWAMLCTQRIIIMHSVCVIIESQLAGGWHWKKHICTQIISICVDWMAKKLYIFIDAANGKIIQFHENRIVSEIVNGNDDSICVEIFPFRFNIQLTIYLLC